MKISPAHLKILAYTLDAEGFDSAAVLQRCELSAEQVFQEEGDWVPVEWFDRMMAEAIAETGNPSFGLIAGKSLALARYGPFTPLVLFSPHLRKMLTDIRRFALLVLERTEIELVDSESEAKLVLLPIVQGQKSRYFRTEVLLTAALQMLRFSGAKSDDIYSIHLSYVVDPQTKWAYEVAFGQPISCEQGECAIHFNRALLDVALPTYDPLSYVAAQTRAESALAAQLAKSDMAEKVRQALLAAFPRRLSSAATASSLRISERSLRRGLSVLGVTHDDLVKECQLLMAQKLIADGEASIKQISDTLGFASTSSFHRAFRRWTGLTPLQWQASSRGNASALKGALA